MLIPKMQSVVQYECFINVARRLLLSGLRGHSICHSFGGRGFDYRTLPYFNLARLLHVIRRISRTICTALWSRMGLERGLYKRRNNSRSGIERIRDGTEKVITTRPASESDVILVQLKNSYASSNLSEIWISTKRTVILFYI